MTDHQVFNINNTTKATIGHRAAYHSKTPGFTPVFSWVRVAQFLVFCVVFCRSLFLLSYFCWSLDYLSFSLRLLFTPKMNVSLRKLTTQLVLVANKLIEYAGTAIFLIFKASQHDIAEILLIMRLNNQNEFKTF